MKYWKIGILLSVIVSVTALAISIIRCEPMSMDWATFLVTILSALICALIGWQIYTLIDLRKFKKSYKRPNCTLYWKANATQLLRAMLLPTTIIVLLWESLHFPMNTISFIIAYQNFFMLQIWETEECVRP